MSTRIRNRNYSPTLENSPRLPVEERDSDSEGSRPIESPRPARAPGFRTFDAEERAFWGTDNRDSTGAGHLADDERSTSSTNTSDRIIPDPLSPEDHAHTFPSPPVDPHEAELAQFHAYIIGGHNFGREIFEANQYNPRINPQRHLHPDEAATHRVRQLAGREHREEVRALRRVHLRPPHVAA